MNIVHDTHADVHRTALVQRCLLSYIGETIGATKGHISAVIYFIKTHKLSERTDVVKEGKRTTPQKDTRLYSPA